MSKEDLCVWRRHAAFWSACLRALCVIFCLIAADDSFSLPNLDQSSIVTLWDHDGDNENDAVGVTRDSDASFSITAYLGEPDSASACGPDGADDACRMGRRVRAFPPTGPPAIRA
jgi:hypothetical protein